MSAPTTPATPDGPRTPPGRPMWQDGGVDGRFRWHELPNFCGLRIHAFLHEVMMALHSKPGTQPVRGFEYDGIGWWTRTSAMQRSDAPVPAAVVEEYGPQMRGEDCGCRTHVGQHAAHMDALWRARNRDLAARAEQAREAGDEYRAWLGYQGLFREEAARLTEKLTGLRRHEVPHVA